MLIDITVLYKTPFVIVITTSLVFFGTIGKAAAAYLIAKVFKLQKHAGQMMFGLTAAHAAGSIAMLLVGLEIAKNGGSEQIVTNDVLNGVW